jgi:uncharacterized protein YbjT (DUF2867 family)
VGAGEVALPAGDTREPFLNAEDIADVAVAALTDDRHIGELYELTGPRLLSFADAVKEIADATGREIRYVPVLLDAFASVSSGFGKRHELRNHAASSRFNEIWRGRFFAWLHPVVSSAFPRRLEK